MSETIPETAFAELFQTNTPLLDVRAPIEFEQGAFPCAVNLPILNDQEREIVGKTYKQHGKEKAIETGHKLVGDQQKQQRLEYWIAYKQENPSAVLYCFRGGLRSQTVQQWLTESNIHIPLVEGGYKALRNFLIGQIDQVSEERNFVIIGGKTGSAKTHLLNRLISKIDLEGIANHRGSAFGRRVVAQANQINFENQLACALLRLPAERNKIFLEDESRAIGSLSIPLTFHQGMSSSPIAMVEESLEFRIDTILNDYIISNLRDFESLDKQQAATSFSEFLLGSLQRIKKRLGGERYTEVSKLMEIALSIQQAGESNEAHKLWIKSLLQNYYDPMYEYQMGKKLERVAFRGNSQEFLDWASHIDSSSSNNADA
ncbi:MAG: tRNA 2-selenouridine(34) synthase MnmH [Gammaproteobacteria bacterium]|jgi:tRNA 2-selenouridine synthase|nr:tRNA 2-selenouridine(34) synthase MnmH [Gammaproteobacteria bacterium]MBT3858768.1 tRNA 2-selenouridine(34) synthase MnmH [Gammaproteobacteria bacterium]MBT3986120.1 tRNA 2-selenouridine(34) synthase MnmH [Gammaproteobacteria bacterium]MBT4256345.1 tRNA 2-selenouridine(34) synthase MnmH [Gammaproteobacteria bacterium]MBT4581019.1 tRNA 2-selenouridine(34) synthase MnmH [Gammaproteobacteria bacterium]